MIRNDKGEVMAAMVAKGPEVFCSEEAELLACRKAIEFVMDVGFSELPYPLQMQISHFLEMWWGTSSKCLEGCIG